MPNGPSIQSTHTGELDIPALPFTARTTHHFPELANHSLLSVATLCDNGCEALFTSESVTISLHGNNILTGTRDNNGLWTIDIQPPIEKPTRQLNLLATADTIATANATTSTSTTKDIVNFLHATCFSPATSTLIKAIENNHFTTWPGLTTNNVKKHLTKSIATTKGHLDQERKNKQSTKPKRAILDDFVASPPITDGTKTKELYATIVTLSADTNKIYTDQTGRFPVQSSQGNKYLMVLYDYDSNAILAEPLKNRNDTTILAAFEKMHNQLIASGLKPALHILDNEASNILRRFLSKQDIAFQLAPPHSHRRNAAERAIRTFKNHFIAGLCTCNKNFPLHLWDLLVPQATITLNLLRQSRINPHLSAYAQLFGNFDFNKTPMAPPGTLSVGHEKPSNRGTWAPHGSTAWYVGPALNHYRCYTLYMPKTHATRIFDTVEFFNDDYPVPQTSSQDAAIRAAQDLTEALKNPHPAAPFLNFGTAANDAIKQLAEIFTNALPRVKEKPTPPVEKRPAHPYNTRAQKKVALLTVQELKPKTADTPLSDHFTQAESRDDSFIPYANAVIDEDTGEALEYRQLINHPKLGKRWNTSAANEFGRLAQGIRDLPGTDTIKFIPITAVPKGRSVTYARFVCTLRPQKDEVERTRITVGGNLIDYPGEVTTRTADITTAKLLWNSVLSKRKNNNGHRPKAKFCGFDIKNFYLNTPMERPEYMRVHISLIPQEIIERYNLLDIIHDGYVYIEINKGMYGLPQAGIIANKLLAERLANHGYYQSPWTPGLWKHTYRPIQFTLVVDDFGAEYEGQEHADHLYATISKYYECSADWEGTLYCGITLRWDYNRNILYISMPGYVEAALIKYEHPRPKTPQHCPYAPPRKQYGAKVQMTEMVNDEPVLPKSEILRCQQIVGTFLYYGRAIDSTMAMPLSSLASEQLKATATTKRKFNQFLDYAATHPDAVVQFKASDMQLKVHSDASYLSEPQARSRAAGHFFLDNQAPNTPLGNNGAILNPTGTLKHVVSSAAESEVGGLFVNAKEATSIRTTLTEMGWKQQPTDLITDNSTAHGIANGSIKQQRSKAMDMRFYWIRDRCDQDQFRVKWEPGETNLADYFSKHHSGPHHRRQRKYYLANYVATRLSPSTSLRGCVETPDLTSDAHQSRSGLPPSTSNVHSTNIRYLHQSLTRTITDLTRAAPFTNIYNNLII